MSATLSIQEGEPAYYPRVLLNDDPADLISPAIMEPRVRKIVTAAWQRVEGWIAHRWNVRPVTFVVEGPGEWVPPLRPFTPTSNETWVDNAWVSCVVAPSPLGGYCLDSVGPFRFAGDLGSTGEPPRVVKEAVFRLVEYIRGIDAIPEAERAISRLKTTEQYQDLNSEVRTREFERELQNPNWIARAMQQSGAADLLRPWRRLGTR